MSRNVIKSNVVILRKSENSRRMNWVISVIVPSQIIALVILIPKGTERMHLLIHAKLEH